MDSTAEKTKLTEIKAKYLSVCSQCRSRIEIGDVVFWNPKRRGRTYCKGCADSGAADQAASASAAVPEIRGIAPDKIVVDELAKETPEVKTQKTDADKALIGLVKYLEGKIGNSVDADAVLKIVRAEIDKAVLPKALEVKAFEGKPIRIDNPHQRFETLAYLVGRGHHVYLYGSPGSGKSTGAHQVADALNVSYGYISLNPQTPDSRLLGYMDAGGTYRPSVFRKLYETGGVFCIDELDNASASLLTTLNSMLENGHGAFPDAIIKRHERFCCVGTGNTNGRGGNAAFPERRAFDAAFSERFTFLSWEYDEGLENRVCMSINPKAGDWICQVWKVRRWCQENAPRVLVTPRVTFKGALYLLDDKLTYSEIWDMLVFKGIDADTKDKIIRANWKAGMKA